MWSPVEQNPKIFVFYICQTMNFKANSKVFVSQYHDEFSFGGWKINMHTQSYIARIHTQTFVSVNFFQLAHLGNFIIKILSIFVTLNKKKVFPTNSSFISFPRSLVLCFKLLSSQFISDYEICWLDFLLDQHQQTLFLNQSLKIQL